MKDYFLDKEPGVAGFASSQCLKVADYANIKKWLLKEVKSELCQESLI